MSNETVTAVIQPDGTAKEVNPLGEFPDWNVFLPHQECELHDSQDRWYEAERNRRVWMLNDIRCLISNQTPMLNAAIESGITKISAGTIVTGHIHDGKFFITEIKK